ncbi:hypothetical protein CDAR_277401 [Caerostris darwini]|uniref:Uncharacterized protein n=1 Tax=Caerostris darwini TaxID=1538125 RepID=A0AAV4VR89_9ARAC|nr:hypothetical protein CDAR_277401 [Caerostris darwini]
MIPSHANEDGDLFRSLPVSQSDFNNSARFRDLLFRLMAEEDVTEERLLSAFQRTKDDELCDSINIPIPFAACIPSRLLMARKLFRLMQMKTEIHSVYLHFAIQLQQLCANLRSSSLSSDGRGRCHGSMAPLSIRMDEG